MPCWFGASSSRFARGCKSNILQPSQSWLRPPARRGCNTFVRSAQSGLRNQEYALKSALFLLCLKAEITPTYRQAVIPMENSVDRMIRLMAIATGLVSILVYLFLHYV